MASVVFSSCVFLSMCMAMGFGVSLHMPRGGNETSIGTNEHQLAIADKLNLPDENETFTKNLDVMEYHEYPIDVIPNCTHRRQKRSGMPLKWPHNTVMYYINEGDFTDSQKDTIKLAMNTIEYVTCVKFIEKYPKTDDYLTIEKSNWCSSPVGYSGGRQYMFLNPKYCVHYSTLLHELVHALGFDHMHNHPRRDDYITIQWENIIQTDVSNFRIEPKMAYLDFGVPYDFDSITHYWSTAFTKNGKPTIVPKNGNKIGNAKKLSEGDIKKINGFYGCKM